MQWGQIKTLFIVCFLILDVFLVQQFFEKREQAQIGLLPDSTIEEQLEAEKITLGDLPKESIKETYISARRYVFNDEDQKKLDESENQSYQLFNDGTILLSELEESVPIDVEASDEDITTKVKDQILHGENYEYWGYNKEANKLLFFQSYKDNPIFFNESGVVIVFLNENQEMTRYVQTMLDDFNKTGEKQELIKPKQAAITLFSRNELYNGDNVSDMNLGYYTLVPLSNGLQVFAPTWKILVNGERQYYVNAMEGQLISMDENTFVEDTIQNLLDQIEQ
ncbi:two-component system regulatory protein YycI [Pontibacillus marinus]|uniref:Regulatory protein yycI n=1 Tax=Pontibacillus marinus BH030004 = DSM 16465 TaxID=1385511 RepID=A0A0A5GDQ1_9BACI|nr:two-component system regulatory protein YycI [Pontibacillus marinus]KGX89255.1 regulatory protein yycI [Pontibacillus marinus BH030004 = DSM 16465]